MVAASNKSSEIISRRRPLALALLCSQKPGYKMNAKTAVATQPQWHGVEVFSVLKATYKLMLAIQKSDKWSKNKHNIQTSLKVNARMSGRTGRPPYLPTLDHYAPLGKQTMLQNCRPAARPKLGGATIVCQTRCLESASRASSNCEENLELHAGLKQF